MVCTGSIYAASGNQAVSPGGIVWHIRRELCKPAPHRPMVSLLFFPGRKYFLWAFPDSLGKVQIVRDILVAMALSALGYGISCFVHLPWGLDIALFVQGYLMLGRWLRLVGVHRLSAAWCVLLPVFLIALQVYVNGSFSVKTSNYG